METQRILIANENHRKQAMALLAELPCDEQSPLVLEIRLKTRSDEQNRKFHALLGDISRQLLWQSEPLDVQGWKNLLVSGHTIATNLPYKLVRGLEGELVNVRESTARMNVQRMASLIEYTLAWGVEQGVVFSDLRDGNY